MQQVEIYTDGACRGNPGPGGWGAILRCQGREKQLKGAQSMTTNNRMELTAAVQALNALNKPCQVALYTDSRYLQHGISSWIHRWKQNGWKTSNKKEVKNADLWQALEEAVHKHQVSWHWVKGHSGHADNDLADALANQAIDELLMRQL